MRFLLDPNCGWLCPLSLSSPNDTITAETKSSPVPPVRNTTDAFINSGGASPIMTPEGLAQRDLIAGNGVLTPHRASDRDTEVLDYGRSSGEGKKNTGATNMHKATNADGGSSAFGFPNNAHRADHVFVPRTCNTKQESSPNNVSSAHSPTSSKTTNMTKDEEAFVPDWSLVADTLAFHARDGMQFRWTALRQKPAHVDLQEYDKCRKLAGYASPWGDVYRAVYGSPVPAGGGGRGKKEGSVAPEESFEGNIYSYGHAGTSQRENSAHSPPMSWPIHWFNLPPDVEAELRQRAREAYSLVPQESDPGKDVQEPEPEPESIPRQPFRAAVHRARDYSPHTSDHDDSGPLTNLSDLPFQSSGSFAPRRLPPLPSKKGPPSIESRLDSNILTSKQPVPHGSSKKRKKGKRGKRGNLRPGTGISVPLMGRGSGVRPPPGFDRVTIVDRTAMGGWHDIGGRPVERLTRIVEDTDEDGEVMEEGLGYMESGSEENACEEANLEGEDSEATLDAVPEDHEPGYDERVSEQAHLEATTAKENGVEEGEKSDDEVLEEGVSTSRSSEETRDSVKYADADEDSEDSLYTPY